MSSSCPIGARVVTQRASVALPVYSQTSGTDFRGGRDGLLVAKRRTCRRLTMRPGTPILTVASGYLISVVDDEILGR